MLSSRLKECRKIKHVTQREVAEFLGMAVGAYQRYELGTREPNIETLNELSDFFDCSTDYLLGRTNVKKREHVSTVASGTLFDDLDTSSEIYTGIMLTLNEDNQSIIAECINLNTREYLKKEFPVLFAESFFMEYLMELWHNGERTHADDFDATVKSIYKRKPNAKLSQYLLKTCP